jgi:hypothetical protein
MSYSYIIVDDDEQSFRIKAVTADLSDFAYVGYANNYQTVNLI